MTSTEDTERLSAAQAAFERGDFAEVRSLTKELAASLDGDTRVRARALLARVSVDPLAVGVWVVALGFFLLVVFRYFGPGR